MALPFLHKLIVKLARRINDNDTDPLAVPRSKERREFLRDDTRYSSKMIAAKVALLVFLFLVSRSSASPIAASIFEPIIAVPTFVEEDQRNLAVLPAEVNEKEEIFVPNIFLVLGGYLTDPENTFSGDAFVDSGPTGRIEKRDVHQERVIDDLETAAGTNVLRPLFVYRQQLAYRQRLRDAIRRGNRL